MTDTRIPLAPSTPKADTPLPPTLPSAPGPDYAPFIDALRDAMQHVYPLQAAPGECIEIDPPRQTHGATPSTPARECGI